jgi:hypothetical protein
MVTTGIVAMVTKVWKKARLATLVVPEDLGFLNTSVYI